MDKTHYIISDAAKELHVEPHVLRYWEDELSLHIPRNNMGHRIYGPKEMDLFRQVMLWKSEGLSLKEIQLKCPHDESAGTPVRSHQVIPYPTGKGEAPTLQVQASPLPEEDRMNQFKKILGRIVSDAIRDNSEDLTTDIAENVSLHVSKELDYLFREKEEADELRFRNLDETIRNFQKARQEAAATEMAELKSKSRRHKIHKRKR